MIWTVFPTNTEPDECYASYMMPQDFPTMKEAEAWQCKIKEDYGVESVIDTNDGECV